MIEKSIDSNKDFLALVAAKCSAESLYVAYITEMSFEQVDREFFLKLMVVRLITPAAEGDQVFRALAPLY